MIAGSIARRYAKALLEIGVAQRNFDALNRELERVAALYHDSKELSEVLANPVFPLARRQGVVEELVRRLALSKVIRNFLLLLLDRGRIAYLPSIAREHRALVDLQAGRLRARVTVAKALGPQLEARIKATLEKKTGRAVLLETREDPSIIGGVVTQVGDLVYDGSVRTQLQTLREQLLAE